MVSNSLIAATRLDALGIEIIWTMITHYMSYYRELTSSVVSDYVVVAVYHTAPPHPCTAAAVVAFW